jgi:hypothetical protein
MANYIATTDMTLEAAIAAGPMNDGDNLTINNGAVITCTQTPSILLGRRTINDGKLFIDGKNISSGNVINFCCEYQDASYIYFKGTLEVDGDWYSIGTTNGTDSQTFNLTSYWGGTLEDLIPAIWVETGRRIDFDNDTGEIPEVDDWVYKTSDDLVMGRIVEVQSTYIVVKFLTGSLADNDSIEVRKIVDNEGPDYQISWTAQVANASGDIKEAGIYQEFANVIANSTSYITTFNHHLGGFVFEHTFQSNTLTMGSSTGGGFVPPSGCDVKVPNVHFSTSNLTSYASGDTYQDGSNFENNRDEIIMSGAGKVELSICNVGSSFFGTSGAYYFYAYYVGAPISLGSAACLQKSIYNNCVIINDPFALASNSNSAIGIVDCGNGADIIDCLVVQAYAYWMYLGADTSSNVLVKNCISVLGGSTYGANTYLFCYYARRCENFTIDNCVGISADIHSNAKVLVLRDTNDATVTDIIAASSQDYQNPTLTTNAIAMENAKDVYLCGWKTLGPAGYRVFYFTDCNRIKFRCLGRIESPDDVNNKSRELFTLVGSCVDIDISRIWAENSTYNFLAPLPTTAIGTLIGNCSYDYDQTFDIAGVDTVVKGLHAGSGSIGAPGGINASYPGDIGIQIHDGFKSDTSGFIVCALIPPSDNNNYITIVNGSPEFNGDGSLNMSNGDIIEVEQSYFSKGHISFTGNITSMLGSGAISWGTDEWTDVTVEFQYDTGSGWNGSWLNARTAGNWTGISSISSGIKLKYRFTATDDVTDMFMFITETTTSLSAQAANLHPIDQSYVTVKVIAKDSSDYSLIENARVYLVADAGGPLSQGTLIFNQLTNASGYVQNTEYLYTADQPVVGWIRRATTPTLYKPTDIVGTITSSGLTITGIMVPD